MRSGERRGGSHAAHVAGDALLHPLPLAAVAVLLVNDHYLKAAWPGVVTGKLSDVAGLAFFPLLLAGAWELGLLIVRRWSGPRRRPVIVATLATGVTFAVVKTTGPGAAAFGAALAIGQWLPAAAAGLAGGGIPGLRSPALVTADPTDLVALPALLVPLVVGLRRAGRARDAS